MERVNIFWFRRDLRIHDNTGLFHCLNGDLPVVPVFIFDCDILDRLSEKRDRRVEFIYGAIKSLNNQLAETGSSLLVFHGTPLQAFQKLSSQFEIDTVFTNHDYEPYAIERDNLINGFLLEKGISFRTFKDQVIFEKSEVLKANGTPYTVFTPYSKRWKILLNQQHVKSYPTEKLLNRLFKMPVQELPSLERLGFLPTGEIFPSPEIRDEVIKQYEGTRNFPAKNGTTHLGVHLRFGTVSIRDLVRRANDLSDAFLNELIWREFYMSILWHFPHVGKNHSFKPEYDRIKWQNDEEEFERWCKGMTGFPIVDAGMRQLNATGYMHNRLRMITGSFLVKDLLIDWRWGEAYFAEKLLDFDLAANNGGWQWVAGSGCDAAPYFRIFNPDTQAKKFDGESDFIDLWVPEFRSSTYPKPIIDHKIARERCIVAYRKALSEE
jgi:deoxyribodipyrimidine photo-lyase